VSAWMMVVLAVVGSCVTLIVNVVVIAHIYGNKEAKWDAFCEQARRNQEKLDKLALQFAAHTGQANGYTNFDKYQD
jgi:thymidylate synthase